MAHNSTAGLGRRYSFGPCAYRARCSRGGAAGRPPRARRLLVVAITAWRIVKARHAPNAFDGEGARLEGGRWNSPGTPLVYASESAALATLELLVHLRRRSILSAYVLIACTFDEALVERLDSKRLPPNWRSYPAPPELQL